MKTSVFPRVRLFYPSPGSVQEEEEAGSLLVRHIPKQRLTDVDQPDGDCGSGAQKPSLIWTCLPESDRDSRLEMNSEGACRRQSILNKSRRFSCVPVHVRSLTGAGWRFFFFPRLAVWSLATGRLFHRTPRWVVRFFFVKFTNVTMLV